MELGCDAVLLATAVTRADDPVRMATRDAPRRRGRLARAPRRTGAPTEARPRVVTRSRHGQRLDVGARGSIRLISSDAGDPLCGFRSSRAQPARDALGWHRCGLAAARATIVSADAQVDRREVGRGRVTDHQVHHYRRAEPSRGRPGERPPHPGLAAPPSPRAEHDDRQSGGHEAPPNPRSIVRDERHQPRVGRACRCPARCPGSRGRSRRRRPSGRPPTPPPPASSPRPVTIMSSCPVGARRRCLFRPVRQIVHRGAGRRATASTNIGNSTVVDGRVQRLDETRAQEVEQGGEPDRARHQVRRTRPRPAPPDAAPGQPAYSTPIATIVPAMVMRSCCRNGTRCRFSAVRCSRRMPR